MYADALQGLTKNKYEIVRARIIPTMSEGFVNSKLGTN